MPSNNELSFHAPGAAFGGVDTVGAANNGMFSRLHLVGNPDWMSSFSSSQQVAAARPALAPPAPVAASAPRALAAPAAIDAPAPASKGFFSMFYRAPASTAAAVGVSHSHAAAGATAAKMPAPPKALDALDSPPQRAMPVDAQLSLEHFSKTGIVEVSMPPTRREPPRPLALGSDTWNALSSIPLPPKTTASGKHILSPPAAIDGVASRAPRPLWSDLSFTSRFRSSAPTLDAFRNAAPSPVSVSPVESALAQPSVVASAVPVPPKPVTTSPLRDTAGSLETATKTSAATAFKAPRRELKAHPLVPVGEEALPVTPLLKPLREETALAAVEATPALETDAALHRDGATSPLLADFVKSVAEPATQQEQHEQAVAAANVRNFLSTLFSREEDSETATTGKADAFNALELAINRGTSQPKLTQPLAYNTFANSPLFMDNTDEDSEESLERLRRVVSIVMQSAMTHDGSSSQPSSQTQRRNGSTAASPSTTGRYTEFSASYHTANNGGNNESEWMQYARF